MTLAYYLRRALTLPPWTTARIAGGMLRERMRSTRDRKRDAGRASYGEGCTGCTPPPLFGPIPMAALRPRAEAFAALAERYLEHRFDLLGSGWVRVAHGMECAGVEGHRYPPGPPVDADREGRWLDALVSAPNRRRARELWTMTGEGYVPIDWQIDFKSGHRWSEATWYRDIAYGATPGADVKVPWELARMQHLPQLALCFALAREGKPGFAAPRAYVAEFRNQVLDFAAANPPRFGANWCCTMDVAIRAANMVAARDLFRAHGAELDEPFLAAFASILHDHGAHVAANLEYNEALRANHYLADLAGLAFIAAALPATRETDRWLAFAAHQLARELALQFQPDGTNFEASTSYHRLSGEMAAYAAALLLGLDADKREALARYRASGWKAAPKLPPAPLPMHPLPGDTRRTSPLPGDVLARLGKAASFTAAYSVATGKAVQIGDNDSGRFLKLHPTVLMAADGVPVEDHGDHRHLVAAFSGLFGTLPPGTPQIDACAVGSLARGVRLPMGTPTGGADTETDFPDFGLYFRTWGRFRIAFRCGHNGQNGNGGHAHNDQLSFSLAVDGVPFVIDPGTCTYTPVPETRNRFRGTRAHASLSVPGREQNRFVPETLFALRDDARARATSVTPELLAGEHHGFGVAHTRTLRPCGDAICIHDSLPLDGARLHLPLAPGIRATVSQDGRSAELGAEAVRVRAVLDEGAWTVADTEYSPAYGLREPNLTLTASGFGHSIDWRLECAAEDGA